jgi:CheY-like chemotaxis protein
VAIIDVRMPGVDGVTLQHRLRLQHPYARYVMMTGYSDEDQLARAHAAGVAAVLSKPVPLPALFAVLAARSPCGLLVVEDDHVFREALCESLDDGGYTCHAVSSAAEARSEAGRLLARRAAGEARNFALIVDVRLPDGDGANLAAELSDLLGAPVLLITGADAEGSRRIVAERCSSVVRALEKPFSPHSLLSALRDITQEVVP